MKSYFYMIRSISEESVPLCGNPNYNTIPIAALHLTLLNHQLTQQTTKKIQHRETKEKNTTTHTNKRHDDRSTEKNLIELNKCKRHKKSNSESLTPFIRQRQRSWWRGRRSTSRQHYTKANHFRGVIVWVHPCICHCPPERAPKRERESTSIVAVAENNITSVKWGDNSLPLAQHEEEPPRSNNNKADTDYICYIKSERTFIGKSRNRE